MTEIDPGNPYSPHKSWNNRTEREELIEIILRWLKSSRPDDSDIPSVLADSILEWHKKGLIERDKLLKSAREVV